MARRVHNLLVNHLHDRALQRFGSQYLHGRMLDIGCGTKPYEAMLGAFVHEHVGLEHTGTIHDASKAELQGTAYEIPADDASFDSVLCTAVLEHLEEPLDALVEAHRVLRPGGYVLYSVPFIWHVHEAPRDFYRYSRYGLEYLFEKAGFEIVTIEALSGFWVTFGQLFVYNVYRFDRGPIRKARLLHPLGLSLQGAAYVLDKLDKSEKWTWMYMVVARRPASDGAS